MPKRGGLKSAGKRQESATFLQRSFFNVAVQFFACCSTAFGNNDVRTAGNRMLQCNFCSVIFQNLQRNFCFRLWHFAVVGFRGVAFRTCRRFLVSGGVQVRFRVRFQVVKVPNSMDSQLRTQRRKQPASKGLLTAISLSECASEGFRVRLRRLSEYGSVAY